MLSFIFVISILTYLSCEQSTDNNGEKAISSVERANEALAAVLYDMINGEYIEEPGDLNFTEPYELYREAYNFDKSNPDANFGLALTGILMITQDQEIQDAMDEWEVYLQSNVPFEASLAKRTKSIFPASLNDFKIPVHDLVKAVAGTSKMAFIEAPKLSTIQNLLENKLLTKLNFARQALDRIDDNPDFVFIITPKMQGDLQADPLQIDLTEIFALEAGVNMFAALVNIGISYDVDFNSYDSLGIIQAFSPGSSFLTVRKSGQYLSDAKNALLTMANKIIGGINFLRAETDDQNDDIIKVDPREESELDDILQSTNDFLDMMTTEYTFMADWDDDSYTPQEELNFNFSKYFNNPIQDFKQLLPAYTISVVRDTIDFDYQWEYGTSTIAATVYFPQTGYYYNNRSYSWFSEGYAYQFADSNINIPEFKQAVDLIITQLKEIPNIRSYSVNLSWGSYLDAGNRQIQQDMWWDYSAETPSQAVFIPVMTWTADSFQEWYFPDPTFNGILPGMTDSEFKRIFGIEADDWSKSTNH